MRRSRWFGHVLHRPIDAFRCYETMINEGVKKDGVDLKLHEGSGLKDLQILDMNRLG